MKAKLYHGAAFYPELWSEETLEQDFKLMKATGINVVRIGEFAWSTIEPREGEIDVSFFVRIIERLHELGIDIVMCTPTPTPPIWLSHGHPERMYVNERGETMSHGSRQHMCTNNDVFREKSAIITEHIARSVGKLPGLIGWQLDNEFKAHVSECMCCTCLKLWHRWLEQRYVTIDRLNDAWGTDIWSERYNCFDQVPQPAATPFLHNSSLRTMYQLFSMEMIAEFADEQAAIIRKHSAAPITHNSSIAFHVDNERLFAALDFASYDTYASQANYAAYMINCDLWRTVKKGRPYWLMETSPSFSGSLESYSIPHPDGYLRSEAVAAYALGAESFCYWLWRGQRAGSEQPHGSVISAWGKPGIGYRNVLAVEEARRKLEPIILSTEPVQAQVAMTYSDRTKAFLRTEPHRKLNYRGLLTGMYELLLKLGIHRDLIMEGAPLDGYKVLVTPFLHHISDEYRARAQSFAANGGIWIIGPLSGGRTKEHTFHTDAALGKLEELAGIETEFMYPIDGTGSIGHAFGLSAPLSLWSTVFTIKEAEAVGTISGGHADGLSFLTERKYGQGKIVMLGSMPAGEEGAELLSKLFSHYAEQAGVTVRSGVTPGTIVAPRRGAEGTVWIAVNMDGKGGSVDLPEPAYDLLSGDAVPRGLLHVPAYGYRALLLK